MAVDHSSDHSDSDPSAAENSGAGPSHAASTRTSLIVLVIAMALPTIVTWIYFVVLADQAARWQQLAAGAGKLVQFLLPAVWVFGVQGQSFHLVRFTRRGLASGLLFGTVAVAAIFLLYFGWLNPSGRFDYATAQILAKVQEIGFSSRIAYVALSAFYAIVHSGLEEYYWRWFVFGQLRKANGFLASLCASSLAFMAHHVIVLGTFMGFDSPLAYLFSLAVAFGGGVWAWLYERYGRIFASWASHMVVDAGIFALGFMLVFGY